MTVITVNALETLLGGAAFAERAYIKVQYRMAGNKPSAIVDGAEVTLARDIPVDILDGVPAEPLDFPPTVEDVTYAVVTVGSYKAGTPRVVRNVIIPDEGPVDFGDLVQVDPESFEPVAAGSTVAQQLALKANSADLGTAAAADAADFATAAQGELADSAYQLPEAGMPASDLAAAVRTSLEKADDALPASEKGAENGVAELVGGKVPAAQTDMAAIAAAPELSAAYVGKPPTRKAFQTLAAPNLSSATAAFDYAYRTMLKLPVATSRWRIGFSNRNLRSATIPTAPVTITGVFVGEPVFATSWASGARWAGACADALTQVSDDLTVPTDGTFVWSDWITDEAAQFAPLVEKVIGWGHSNPASGSGVGYGDSVQYYRAAGNGNAGNATLAGATLTLQSLGDIVIEYEFAGPSQIGLFIGDSNTIGYTPSAPQLFPSAGAGALPHENWPGVAAELGGFVAVNIAVGSALPVDFASALPYLWTRVDLESVDIDFAVVSLGTNGLAGGDANFGLFVSYVLAINAQLRALGIDRIFWADIPPRSLTSGYSTVAVAASAAATTIQVASTLTLDSTNTLLIGSGPNAEIVTVSSGPTGSGPYTYTVSALANAHAAGEHVTSSTETARRRQNIWLRNLPDGISGIIPFEVALEASPGSPNADPRYVASDLLHFQRGAGSLRAATAAVSGVQPKIL